MKVLLLFSLSPYFFSRAFVAAECDALGSNCQFEFDLRIPRPSQGSCCEDLVCVRNEPDAAEIPTCQFPTSAEFEECSFVEPRGCDDGLVCTPLENANICLSMPSASPSVAPTPAPTRTPTQEPTDGPTASPSFRPSLSPTSSPSSKPSYSPSASPSGDPSTTPTATPSGSPSAYPSAAPSCGAVEFQGECSATYECWVLYSEATDCSISKDNGVCFCDTQVCGCRTDFPDVAESETVAFVFGAWYTLVHTVQNIFNTVWVFVFGD